MTCILKRNEKETYSYYETGEEREDVVGEMNVKFREKNMRKGRCRKQESKNKLKRTGEEWQGKDKGKEVDIK